MRFNNLAACALVLLCGLALDAAAADASGDSAAEAPRNKTRVIVTTDGEIDDRCSMVRFLLYANEWDIQGLIHSSSKYHWIGDAVHERRDWEPVEWLDRQLDAYAEVHPNLIKHDPSFPSPDYLRSQVFVGNIAYEGDVGEPTLGSDHIVKVLLEPDTSPVWLQAWGGSNTIARALKTIQENHPDRVDEVSKKTRIYLISEQDDTLKTYLRPEWPEIQILRSSGSSFGAIAYAWREFQSPETQAYFDSDWMAANILQNHGPLCAMYEANKDGSFRSEGDTPAYLHVINTGLRSDEHPSYGGWGGRFKFLHNVWKSVDKKGSSPHSVLRWAEDFQNDWAARADWCVCEKDAANHPPDVVLEGATQVEAHPGDRVSLDVSASTDPDGDELSYHWWPYTAAGTYNARVTIEDADKPIASLMIPKDSKANKTLHVVCTVTDNGEPPLTRYARVVIDVKD